jgi:hypothetical protein
MSRSVLSATTTRMDKAPRPRGSRKAWDEGRAAREADVPREECPHPQDLGPVRRAWLQGWDSLGPVNVRVAVPPVRTQEPAHHHIRRAPFYLEHHEVKARLVYRRPQPVPCESCACVYLPTMSPAVVTQNMPPKAGVVYMACRACGHSFKVPVV